MTARRSRLHPCTLVYLTMVALTLATFGIGMAGLSGLGVSLIVLALALIKGQMLGDYFMELKGLKGPWRWVILLWLFVPGVLIAAAFALSR
jgi:heme/copper-type cytochrome/quinol oxidase subunit 4